MRGEIIIWNCIWCLLSLGRFNSIFALFNSVCLEDMYNA